MAAPNIVSVSTITGKTAAVAVGTSATTVVSNAASSGKVYKINSLIISNVDGSASATIDVDFYRSATARYLANTISVPAGSTLVVIDKSTSIYLEENDSIRATASAAGDLEAICSYEEIS